VERLISGHDHVEAFNHLPTMLTLVVDAMKCSQQWQFFILGAEPWNTSCLATPFWTKF
jgi:hypothetical protein